MKMAGVPMIVGQSHLAVSGRNVKFTTENAVTTAMYEAIMLVMWWYHQALRSVGGLTKAQTSRPAKKSPIVPRTTATILSWRHVGEGWRMPITIRAELAASVSTAAVQSKAAARWPSSGRLR